MDAHTVLDAVNCAGDLAFAVVMWGRHDRSPSTRSSAPLAFLLMVAFGWSFCELAHDLSGATSWRGGAHVFSTLLPILAVHVVAVFVGRSRALRGWLRAGYALSFAATAASFSSVWWKLRLGLAVLATLGSIRLLVEHLRRDPDPDERARARLILLAFAVGSAVGAVELCYSEMGYPLPHLSNLGALVALSLFAVGALRVRLLGREVPVVVGAYGLVAGASWAVAGFAALHLLRRETALLALSLVTTLLVVLAALREVGRRTAVKKERLRRLAGMGRFSEPLAHDLRNPLATLKGALQFLSVERQQGRSLDAQSDYLPLMLEQVERLTRVIADYQRLARVEPVRARGSLNEVVREVIGLQRFAVTSGVKVSVDLAEELPECDVDRELLATTLENILRNAYEAMPDGGVVTVRTHASGSDAVLLSVKDEGRGMDARELEVASDEFFTTKAGGTGLGLHFAARVARAHGGSLDLTSNVRRGTTVSLRIPLSSR